MRHRPFALVLISLLTLSLVLAGCRRSAAPALEPLEPEDEGTAMLEEAQENTEQMDEEATPTTAPDEAGDGLVDEEAPTPTTEAGTEPQDGAPAGEEPTPTTAPVAPAPAGDEAATAPTPETAPATVEASPGVYVVQPGDNLFRIALRYGLTVDQLAQANSITNPSQISVGQQLVIPSGDAAGGAAAPAGEVNGTTCSVVHVVTAGENLFRIALRYNVSLPYLAQVNGITNPSNVYVGQSICIP